MRFWKFVCLVALGTLLAPRPAVGGEKEEEAAALVARAAQLAHFRSPGSTPFRLQAEVRLLGLSSGPVSGKYLLHWVSPQQWRESLTLPGYYQLRVGGDGKLWWKRNLNHQPVRVHQFATSWNIVSRLRIKPDEEVKKLRDRKRDGIPMRCVELEQGKSRRELCVEALSGNLLRERQADITYEYFEHTPLAKRMIPGRIHVLEHGKKAVEIQVEEIESRSDFPKALFQPPAGAVEWPWCSNPEPAEAIERPFPEYPEMAKRQRRQGIVSVYVVIDTDGSVKNAAVVRSAGDWLDESALDTVKGWRFAPAKCGAQPVPSETIIDVTFALYPG